MSANKSNKIKPCYLCGSTTQVTREHLPAKNLFPKPRPSNLITVPCCYECNNKYSKEDEYFRVAVSSLINANPTGKAIWKQKVIASTMKSRRIGKLVDDLGPTVKPVILQTPLGNVDATIVEFKGPPINSVLRRLTKGLGSIVMEMGLVNETAHGKSPAGALTFLELMKEAVTHE